MFVMTPKEKAKELFLKYDSYPLTTEWKRQCALIAIDEVLYAITEDNAYWEEVKKELETIEPVWEWQ